MADSTSNFAPRWTFQWWRSTTLECEGKSCLLQCFSWEASAAVDSAVSHLLSTLPPSLSLSCSPSEPVFSSSTHLLCHLSPSLVCVCCYLSLCLYMLTLSSLPSQWLQQLVVWVAAAIVDSLLVLLSGALTTQRGRKSEWEREKTEKNNKWKVFNLSKYFVFCFRLSAHPVLCVCMLRHCPI